MERRGFVGKLGSLIICCLASLFFVSIVLPSGAHAASKPKLYALYISGITGSNATNGDVSNIIQSKVLYVAHSSVSSKFLFYDPDRKNSCTKDTLLNTISNSYSNASSNDTVLFFCSSHGRNNTLPGTTISVQSGIVTSNGTYADYKDIAKKLAKTKSNNIIVIIDACFSGNFINRGLGALNSKDKKRFSVYVASNTSQYSYMRGDDKSSYYSDIISDILGNSSSGVVLSDLNSDGKVTASEFADSCKKYYYALTPKRILCKQTPQSYCSSASKVLFSYDLLSVSLNKKNLSLRKGKTAVLTAKVKGLERTVTWKSSNSSIATVNSSGKITAKKVGQCIITASVGSFPAKTAKCTVKVTK